ncbi:MAG: Ribonuclease HI [Candidatus Nomurabacteria bacterium GW2011_GWA2_41_25]|uniref:ribonuclease H n=1 Tax=Candidatus Nomurabacteria bacterium GW2011_GWA2_41_25 TaxID=1618736 RepID=A0A0G0VWI4_9BACT|nr:MAG: Ribonuclease HI [Candidatus Nomurabacteria bacterium GW2011_GWA2_41_25]OGI66939.1 MAG: hypothetical protein A2823_02455 [Candidatus Nomurabacteria bacterium RIFCSPHIGHO2_01_FULL_41_91]OGI80419.1 MAG: hypothetical protein A3D43_00075 [Candidatus Nomurabacteria bacterium RIFCSPHIGHO2_02_FULL_41_52]OGI94043.1 MAG: hypothetical protein A3A07_01880 [Candidatus Nomurabacteria bacterium RIFCSPLOWO2_01_FULL_41_52]
MYDYNALKIYTDGSAIPNPGKGGIGIIIEFPDSSNSDNLEISEGYMHTTNNRMELIACITAIQWLRTNGSSQKITRAIIITDSDYVYSNYKNAQYWKEDGWKNQDGKPYENKDIWDTFLKERYKIRTPNEIKWEKGKTRPILLRVDALAKQGAKNPIKTDYGYQPGKFTATRSASKKAATMFIPNNEELIIRVFAKKIYGKNQNEMYKITFDVYDEIQGIYTKKFFAYQGKECITLKRNNCYRAKMNGNLKLPLILEAEAVEYLKNKP